MLQDLDFMKMHQNLEKHALIINETYPKVSSCYFFKPGILIFRYIRIKSHNKSLRFLTIASILKQNV